MTVTFSDVIDYISAQATQEDVTRIFEAGNGRVRTLRLVRSASVRCGSVVRFVNIKPRYLVGLSGEVVRIAGARCDVRLDANSSLAARITGRACADDILRGVPLSACEQI